MISYIIASLLLNYNVRRSFLRALAISLITVTVYMLIVIVTTPNLAPQHAINTALTINFPIISGTAIGLGVQSYIASYRQGIDPSCKLDYGNNKKGKHVANSRYANTGGAMFSSFLSFFSLVPLGCCGSWLFILSLLPSIFGGTLSVILIKYSVLLSYTGLSVVLAFTLLSVLRFYNEVKRVRGKRKEERGVIT